MLLLRPAAILRKYVNAVAAFAVVVDDDVCIVVAFASVVLKLKFASPTVGLGEVMFTHTIIHTYTLTDAST